MVKIQQKNINKNNINKSHIFIYNKYMTTIKLSYDSNEEFQCFLNLLRKQYTSVYHFAYNKLWNGYSKSKIYHMLPTLNNIELIKSKLSYDAIDDAITQYEKDKLNNHKSIFGSKKEFIRRCKGLISKDEWNTKRLKRIKSVGNKNENGNRLFKLDVFNNQIIFKYDKKHHYILNIKASKSQLKDLHKLQACCENNETPFSVSLSENEINLSFEEIKSTEKINYIEHRFLGIDMNPSNIGISICDFINNDVKIIHTQNYDFTEITNKIIYENKPLNDKLDFEILQISKSIYELSKHFKCKNIFIEDLNFKNSNKGKTFNRLTKNIWKRNKFIDNLTKRCMINHQGIYQVNAAYSSIIGNCQYDYVDAVNASIEIGRRGYECMILKSKKFYPVIKLKDSLIHRWKEMVNALQFTTWKEVHTLLKDLKISYRVSLTECLHSVKVSRKKVSKVNVYCFQ